MSTPLAPVTVIVRRIDIRSVYPGGEDAYVERFQPLAGPDLFGIGSMSTGEASEHMELLVEAGIPRESMAVASSWTGWIDDPVGWLILGRVGGRNVCWLAGQEPEGAEPFRNPMAGLGGLT